MRISDWSSDVCSSDLLVKDAIAQNAGIVHHRVELAEGAQGIFDDAGGSGGVRNICGVDDRLTARGADFRDDLLGGPDVAAFAVLRAAQIIHTHGSAPSRHPTSLHRPAPAPATTSRPNPPPT